MRVCEIFNRRREISRFIELAFDEGARARAYSESFYEGVERPGLNAESLSLLRLMGKYILQSERTFIVECRRVMLSERCLRFGDDFMRPQRLTPLTCNRKRRAGIN